MQTDGDAIDWTATDFFGAPTSGTTIRVGADGRAPIRVSFAARITRRTDGGKL